MGENMPYLFIFWVWVFRMTILPLTIYLEILYYFLKVYISHCIFASHFHYPFVSCWLSMLFPFFLAIVNRGTMDMNGKSLFSKEWNHFDIYLGITQMDYTSDLISGCWGISTWIFIVAAVVCTPTNSEQALLLLICYHLLSFVFLS